MRTTKQLSITLPNSMAEALKERVASGAYASESEVIRDGLRALFSQEQAIERWLQTEVVASVEAMRADPSRAISAQDMRTYLSGLRTEHSTKKSS